jgi:hypothetical protein
VAKQPKPKPKPIAPLPAHYIPLEFATPIVFDARSRPMTPATVSARRILYAKSADARE